MALAVGERLRERDGLFDPVWARVLFNDLLGLDPRGEKGQHAAVDLLAFPRSVRARLAALARSTEIEGWARARFKTRPGSGASRTAKLVASLMHCRDTPPRTLWRLAQEELSDAALPPIEDVERPLSRLSSVLRSVGFRPGKLRAISHFVESLPALRASWPALEPALVQPLLDWVPAVVGRSGHIERPGVMVPLMVDVLGRAKGARVTLIGTLQDTSALERSVEAALDCSCALWRSRHSNAPPRRIHEVLEATARVDLQLIEGIAQACIRPHQVDLDLDLQLDLTGRSLELPIALAIYDRLIGVRDRGEIRASGTLGMYKGDAQDPLSGDTFLGSVRGETAKALAAEMQLADRFILSKDSDRPSVDVPTVLAATLGAAVDQAFGGSDGHRFVRAPDLAAGFKLTKFSVHEVERFKDELRSGAIIHETSKPLGLVAQALFDVNRRLGADRYRSRGRYTFVRLSPTERGDAAWASIWSALDGDTRDFSEFATASSFWRRAELVARQMSRNAASMADPRLSPHVFVLAGVRRAQPASGLKGGAAGRFDIKRIMADVQTILSNSSSPCDPRLRRRIGETRVILVEDDGMRGFDVLPPVLDADLARAVERLSVFRYGFSFQMARRLLGSRAAPMAEEACEDILSRLQNELCDDGLPLVVVGCSNGWRRREAPAAFGYMLRRRRLAADPLKRLELHEEAAHAIAPILHPGRGDAHVDLATGLSAIWVDEAHAQLSAAREIAVRIGDAATKSRLNGLRLRLLRLSGWFILERLPRMMGQSGNAVVYEDFADRITLGDHPALHARAAAFATMLASNTSDLGERRRLYRRALQHLNNGAKACERLGHRDERGGATFLIASEQCRLAYVGRDEPDDVLAPAYRHLQYYAAHALNYLPDMRELYWGEWFARVGTLIEDRATANRVYRAGLWNTELQAGGQASDETLIGWAATLKPSSRVDPDLLRRVREHLQDGFFRRRKLAHLQAGEPITDRTRAGMRRLYKLAGPSRRPYRQRPSATAR